LRVIVVSGRDCQSARQSSRDKHDCVEEVNVKEVLSLHVEELEQRIAPSTMGEGNNNPGENNTNNPGNEPPDGGGGDGNNNPGENNTNNPGNETP
jgi:hypothetical protein